VHLLHRLDLHQALDRPVDHRIQPLDAGQIVVKRIGARRTAAFASLPKSDENLAATI
jgi:hypothetical protein